MSKRFTVWLDSGANSESRYETTVALSDIGLTNEAWASMSAQEKDDAMREVAFERSDWGFREIVASKG